MKFYIFLKQFTFLASLTSNTLPRQIANAHTLFNVADTLIQLPFLNKIAHIITLIVPGEEHIIKKGTLYLEKRFINTPVIMNIVTVIMKE